MTSTCIFGLSTEVDDVTSDVWSRDNLVAEGRTLSTFLIRSTEPGKEINSLYHWPETKIRCQFSACACCDRWHFVPLRLVALATIGYSFGCQESSKDKLARNEDIY